MLAKLDIRSAEPPASDVLDLTEAMAAAGPPQRTNRRRSVPSTPRPTSCSPTGRLTRPSRRPSRASSRSARPPPPPRRSARIAALISASTIAAVDSAFNSLAHTVIGQNARTLEDLVKEMLRPLLKSWLDDNLPGVVDRIVRAEIERVSRGRP